MDRADRLGELSRFLGMLDRATPKYAILGNWEHWGRVNLDELDALYRAASCRLLINDHAVHEVGGRAVRLTGIDDLVGGRPDAWKALGGASDADAHVVLAHCPEHRDRLGAHGGAAGGPGAGIAADDASATPRWCSPGIRTADR